MCYKIPLKTEKNKLKNPGVYVFIGIYRVCYVGIKKAKNIFIEKEATREVIDLLLDCGASASITDMAGMTALMYAGENNISEDVIKLLLDRGSKVDEKNKYGMTPLFYASGNNSSQKVVELLLDIGANPNEKDIDGRTALM
ncbi:MAG: ankyrin repeat domain-containing protein [Clostridiales bacterium]|nr:ankyrin repeat domain-containing protein [Clostridiales bacterium]